MHLGRNITYECLLNQSVFYQVLNAASDDVFKRKCLMNGEIMFHSEFKKDTEKVILLALEVKGLKKKKKKKKKCMSQDKTINVNIKRKYLQTIILTNEV